MARFLRGWVLLLALLSAWAAPARADIDQMRLVGHALNTVERMATDENFQREFLSRLRAARGVLIIPSLFKGGFILGGQYGNGVLLARRDDGQWSYPAFYTVSGGSLGFQIGAESTAIIFVIQSDRGLAAMLDSQFKFGADAGLTVVAIGGGVNASSSVDMTADIVAFATSGIGLYGGLSLEGTVVSPRESWNAAYYGRELTTRAILFEAGAANPQADRLRDFLER